MALLGLSHRHITDSAFEIGYFWLLASDGSDGSLTCERQETRIQRPWVWGMDTVPPYGGTEAHEAPGSFGPEWQG
jgi:hypothetical protein